MSNSRHNKSQPVMKRQKRRHIYNGPGSLSKEMPAADQEQQTPLQLSNLAKLMANLQKTGDLQQANEEAYKLKQAKTKKSGALNNH